MPARPPAILLALGVGKDIAINFSLASGLLLVTSAVVAAICGVLSLRLRSGSLHGVLRPCRASA